MFIRLPVLKVTDEVLSLLVFNSISLDAAVPCLLIITKLSYPKVKALNLEGIDLLLRGELKHWRHYVALPSFNFYCTTMERIELEAQLFDRVLPLQV